MDEILPLIQQAIAVIGAVKTLGAVGVLAAVVALLVAFTKTSLGQKLLTKLSLQHKWLRPVVACVLGFLAAASSALAFHKPWMAVLVSGIGGVVAALAGVGGHELLTVVSSSGRTERQAASAVARALTGDPEAVKTKVESFKADLDKAAAIPDKKARMAAVAAWALRNPPGAP